MTKVNLLLCLCVNIIKNVISVILASKVAIAAPFTPKAGIPSPPKINHRLKTAFTPTAIPPAIIGIMVSPTSLKLDEYICTITKGIIVSKIIFK